MLKSALKMSSQLYLRIGTDYFKKVEVPLNSGDQYKTLFKWKKSEIVTDEGKNALKIIPKYDGFCLIPSHTEYKSIINNFYNKYEEIDHKLQKGSFVKTERFLTHIFGNQLILGLDYLTILWRYPNNMLPILCLVSEKRKTGKTTFLNWLKLIFQGNMTINKNEDFRSRFNADWSTKLIIAVDEVLLDKKEDSERIKNLSTANSYKTESKGIDKNESEFFGKFILCSNNESSFIYVDKDEIRYWVIQVPELSDDNEKPDLLNDLKKEIPYFLEYINKREIVSQKKTRMWFTKEQIHTKALDRLVTGNRTYLNSELEEILIDQFIKYDFEILKYSLSDLVELLNKNNVRVSSSKVSELLKNHYKMESKNGMYDKYSQSFINNDEVMINTEKCKGRYFTFERKMFLTNEC
jgi:hypothetical protein